MRATWNLAGIDSKIAHVPRGERRDSRRLPDSERAAGETASGRVCPRSLCGIHCHWFNLAKVLPFTRALGKDQKIGLDECSDLSPTVGDVSWPFK